MKSALRGVFLWNGPLKMHDGAVDHVLRIRVQDQLSAFRKIIIHAAAVDFETTPLALMA